MPLTELLAGAPSNWGRWGPQDEVGTLNLLGTPEVLAALPCVRSGQVFTLGLTVADPRGDPAWPGRRKSERTATVDAGDYRAGRVVPAPGGLCAADDTLALALQGTTHTDALGHTWFDGRLYNGYDADTTTGELTRASVTPLARRGVVGRGVLLDIATHRGVLHLSQGDIIDLPELLSCAAAQGVVLRPRDILVLRTGWISTCWTIGPAAFSTSLPEPGLGWSQELVEWFATTEIVHLATDTMANEATLHPDTGVALPLHAALSRNLGISMTEMVLLDDLAAACRADQRWDFLWVAGALPVHGASGAPVNPVVVR